MCGGKYGGYIGLASGVFLGTKIGKEIEIAFKLSAKIFQENKVEKISFFFKKKIKNN